jgi:hypothetical protein
VGHLSVGDNVPAPKGTPVVVMVSHSSTMVHGATSRSEGYVIAKVEKADRSGMVKEVRSYKGGILFTYNGRGMRYDRVFVMANVDPDGAREVAESHAIEWDDLGELRDALRPHVKAS